jgi:hypothetical protein
MSIEAMKQALAKFEHLWEIGIDAEYKVELLPEIEALRQAIEQAEYDNLTVKFGERAKEYLEGAKKSWDTSAECVHEIDKSVHDDDDIQEYKRPWVGLTDDEAHKIIDDCTSDEAELEELIGFSIAILVVEAKLKEKNNG